MSFIIASIGIIVYIFIIVNEKITYKNNDYHDSSKYKYVSDFGCKLENKFVDRSLENKLRIKVSSEEYKVYQKISPIVCSLHEFPDNFDNHIEFYEFMRMFPNMILRIYLGIDHKILADDSTNGIMSPGVYNDEEIKRWKMHHELMVWLNAQIQEPDGSFEMYFVKGTDLKKVYADPSCLTKLKDIEEPIGGRYCWINITNNAPII